MSTHETTADVDQHLEIHRPEVIPAHGVDERDRVAEHRRRCPRDVAVHPSVEHGDDLRDLACEALQARDLLSEQARIEARAIAEVQPDQRSRVADLPREEVTEQAALLVEQLVAFPDVAGGYHTSLTSAPAPLVRISAFRGQTTYATVAAPTAAPTTSAAEPKPWNRPALVFAACASS
ncbi:uncharacterized protein SOCE836_095660 [Sorangium cellulosum]|uniref:Uncharacterized protein n=1 Tax=Sorangium cellulosum TaxID=56 RepID=A0A4P2R5P0_SORCE|nr:uncharacterized protein SOCE836_095660 [Sorangium cellulosum]WCQ96632.1 hypothetical protein NQZ70_09419 [Sorangium sp. Soce836]